MWAEVDRPNFMVRFPATFEALPAIPQLLSEGINVHVTRLFSLPRYQMVAEAYLAGLEMRLQRGQPLAGVVSVAGFLVSQTDVFMDRLLEEIIRRGGTRAETARSIQGKVAIANAKVAYRAYQQIIISRRFRRLSDHGAAAQRLLWDSMSTKSPGRSDVMYVDSLISPETIITLSAEVLHAYRDHGSPAVRLREDIGEAEETLRRLSELGIDLDEVVQQLRDESIDRFFDSFDRFAMALQEGHVGELEKTINRQTLALDRYDSAVRQRIHALEQMHFGTRLSRKDPSLWKADSSCQKRVHNRLGWLHLAENMEPHLSCLTMFKAEVAAADFRHVVYLGTTANSLVPMVFEQVLASWGDGLPLTVLDTSDPVNMDDFEPSIPLAKTLFVVASKFGTDPKPLAFAENFYSRLAAKSGIGAGRHFVAISDSGTPLARLAETRHFRWVFVNFRDVDERYAALSYFSLVPAALMGLDVNDLLARALRMQDACASCVPLSENPAVVLGAVLG
jgi:transaldolase/glucose-6-phosphate isomerase